MQKLLVMDEHNYDPALPEILRIAVRGIISIEGKLLLIENAFGETKLPGGGIEPGETDQQALIREVKEETGYSVLPDTIVPFGEIEEKRLSTHEPMIWHQYSRLYWCSVGPQQGSCRYTANEQRYGFHQVLYTVDEALALNRQMLDREGLQAWNQREYNTLLLIREHGQPYQQVSAQNP